MRGEGGRKHLRALKQYNVIRVIQVRETGNTAAAAVHCSPKALPREVPKRDVCETYITRAHTHAGFTRSTALTTRTRARVTATWCESVREIAITGRRTCARACTPSSEDRSRKSVGPGRRLPQLHRELQVTTRPAAPFSRPRYRIAFINNAARYIVMRV